MTEQERQLIEGLGERIRNAPAPQIDHDADGLIRQSIGSRPDALYILTQTVLLQEMALNQAKAQIDQLKQQTAAAPQAQSGFLHGQPSSYSSPSYQQSSYQESQYAAPPPPQQPGGRFSGFLHNVATTAAGVIAGEAAFDALSSLFGHRGGYWGGGGGFFGGGPMISPGSETIVNNYYDDDRGGDRGNDSQFADASDNGQDNVSNADDSGDNYDDGSSYDDSGSSDV